MAALVGLYDINDQVIADRKDAAYDFKYTTVTYTVTLVVRGTEKDALTVTKRKN
jgi:hypothetical protein